MNKPLTCAVVTFPTPDQQSDDRRARDSIAEAIKFGSGPFGSIFDLPISQNGADTCEASMHNAAVSAALEHNADWIFLLYPGEALNPDMFAVAHPGLRLFDALWGASSLFEGDQQIERVTKLSSLACQSYDEFFHMALRWWIGRSHFVKAHIAAAHMGDDEPWYAKYLLQLWGQHKCLKTAQPLTSRRGELGGITDPERQYLLHHLEEHPVYLGVCSGQHKAQLPYTGLNPVIEREQTRGVFFEQEELNYLASMVPPGSIIVDVGANTGNHTVYFSKLMDPKCVIPIEPAPRSVDILKKTVAKNNLINVDLSKLGFGANDKSGTFSLKLSQRGGLGATQLQADPGGEIQVAPLDELIEGSVDFLKIDVESMEMTVLAGAEKLITQYHPLIFIEIFDQNIEKFLKWVDGHDYSIEKIYPDKAHANYFLIPSNNLNDGQLGPASE